jgi:hypothetical protein
VRWDVFIPGDLVLAEGRSIFVCVCTKEHPSIQTDGHPSRQTLLQLGRLKERKKRQLQLERTAMIKHVHACSGREEGKGGIDSRAPGEGECVRQGPSVANRSHKTSINTKHKHPPPNSHTIPEIRESGRRDTNKC